MKKQQGFTMLEIIVVMAIIGLIVGIAYPSYLEQMEKSRRAEAKVALSSLVQAQENFYADNNTYTATLGTGGLNCVNRSLCVKVDSTFYTPEKYYVLTATGTARGFTLTATVNTAGRQKDDEDCYVFTLDHKNKRQANRKNGSAGDNSETCW